MAQFIEIESDIEKVQKALEQTNKSIPSIERQVIGIIARGTVKAIKGGMQAVIYSREPAKGYERTGELMKCYGYKVKKEGSGSVYPRGVSGSRIFPKVYALNYGDKIRNKPHGFIEYGQNYAMSGAYEEEIEKMIDKELRKYWGN